jgi:hypothetical protein
MWIYYYIIYKINFFIGWMVKLYKESIIKELVSDILSIKMTELVEDEMYIEVKNTLKLKLREFIYSESTKNLLYRLAEEKMLQLEKEDKTLKEILPPGFENSLKVLVYNKGPEITDAVRGFITSDKFKHTIKVEVSKFISSMGPMVSKFVNAENIYNRIMMSILSYTKSPETMMSIVSGINTKIDEGVYKRISDFSNSLPYQGKLSFTRALVDTSLASLTEDAFIDSIEDAFEKELLKFNTLRELLLSLGITEEKLAAKALVDTNSTI